MSTPYRAVRWNARKVRYDATIAAGAALFLGAFVGVGVLTHPNATPQTLMIRGLGVSALVLLHVVLSIGPLARLDARFLPFLDNRRHLGVATFLLAAAHATFAIVQFHARGDVNPLVSVLASNPRVDSVGQFPFEILGLAALVILFLMASTSHDFWIACLTAPVWKSLHMMVYAAWALIVLHVALGTLQAERQPLPLVLLAAGAAWILGVHLAAGLRERRRGVTGSERDEPPGLRAAVRRRVAVLLAAVVVLGAVLAADMRPFPAKRFERAEPRTFAGWIEADPVPSLLERLPGTPDPGHLWTRYLLVRPGKSGAEKEAAEFDGNPVRLEGKLIYRGDQAMIEIVPGSLQRAARTGAGPGAKFESLGEHTLVGEIVDSKCYLGAMSPGSGKPHRECAARCIAGGIPPLFVVRGDDGRVLCFLLLSRDGKPVNREILPMVAEPLEITGVVKRYADLLVLEADPSAYRRRT